MLFLVHVQCIVHHEQGIIFGESVTGTKFLLTFIDEREVNIQQLTAERDALRNEISEARGLL